MSNKNFKHIVLGLMFTVILEIGVLIGIFVVKSNTYFSPIPLNLVKGIPQAFIVTSGSMSPVIKTGGLVLSVPISVYQTGDVVTFKEGADGKTLVTHRIAGSFYSKENQKVMYYTKGDANNNLDSNAISSSQILGKAILGIPYLGYAANSAKDPKMFILFVIIPATIIVYEELKFLKKEIIKKVSKLFSKFKTRFNLIEKNESEENGINKIFILIPILGVLVLLAGVSGSFFSNIKTSTGNTLTTGEQFPTPIPTPTPTASPSPNRVEALLYNSDSYTCTDGASELSQQQLTNVAFINDGTNVNVIVTLTGATPSSSYDIWINQDPGGCPLGSPTSAGAISTDESGNGTGTASVPIVSGATKFWISAVGGGQVLRSTAVSF